MPKPQPRFTAEFKQEAVQRAKTSDKPTAQIARELGISDSALYSWCKAAQAHGEEAFPGKGHQLPLEEEIHRLKRELERAQQERDSLKKPSASSRAPSCEGSIHCGAWLRLCSDGDVSCA